VYGSSPAATDPPTDASPPASSLVSSNHPNYNTPNNENHLHPMDDDPMDAHTAMVPHETANGLIGLKAATDPTNGVFNRDDAEYDKSSSITVTNPKNNKRVRINQEDDEMGDNEQDNKMGPIEQDNKMGEDDDDNDDDDDDDDDEDSL
jgi:phosphopantothenoylcysteine synthetase/decarboxylase